MKYSFNMENVAKAYGKDLPISRKHAYEVANYIRGKNATKALIILKNVMAMKEAIPYRKHNRDLAHKTGIGPGRYPVKTVMYFIKVIKNAINNAKQKGFEEEKLHIVHVSVHVASKPGRSGRRSRDKKRSHIQVAVGYMDGAKAVKQNKNQKLSQKNIKNQDNNQEHDESKAKKNKDKNE